MMRAPVFLRGVPQFGAGLFAACLLAGLAGCGGTTVVKGVVTLDGVPVDEGSVSFTPTDGIGPSAGTRVVAGAYELSDRSGLTPGKKTVVVRGGTYTGRKIEAGAPFPPGYMIDEMVIFRGNYTVTRDVVARQVNVFDFALKSAGAKR
jgi:hypothetical protein